jgi:hypothetical protein
MCKCGNLLCKGCHGCGVANCNDFGSPTCGARARTKDEFAREEKARKRAELQAELDKLKAHQKARAVEEAKLRAEVKEKRDRLIEARGGVQVCFSSPDVRTFNKESPAADVGKPKP